MSTRIGIFGWGVVAPKSPDVGAFERNLGRATSWLEPFEGFGPNNFLVGNPVFDFAAYKPWIDERFGEDSVVIVTSDHGESLYDDGFLGHGIVLAAHLRGMASAAAYDCLLDNMLERQHEIIPLAIDCGVTAGTDVTGFGLAGHLIEMLQASDGSRQVPVIIDSGKVTIGYGGS